MYDRSPVWALFKPLYWLAYLVVGIVYLAADWYPSAASDGHDGFWWGMLHAYYFTWTFIFSLFEDGVTLYQVSNNGNWYDFGFWMGIMVIVITVSVSSGRSRRN